jgi:integrase
VSQQTAKRNTARKLLTTDSVRKLETDDIRGLRISDSSLSGFGITVYPSGKKTFWCRYGPRKRRRFTTLGAWGKLTVDQARSKAKELLAKAELGDDPVLKQKQKRSVPTFTDWVATYLPQAKLEQKQNTYWKTRWMLARAEEFFSNTAIDEITRNDIQNARLDVAEHRGNRTANRWLSAVRTCLTEAVARDLLRGNPAAGIKKLREPPPRQRVLSDNELARLQRAIAEFPNVYVRTAFWLLIGTGARRSEVLQARWEDIDLDRALWRLPDTKSGRPQTVLLSPAVVDMLRIAPRIEGSPWVVPSWRWPSKHKGDLHREWALLCETAQIEGAVVHDLRRTFGKRIAEQAGLHIASKLLRHADVSTTAAVYAPIDESTLRTALNHDGAVVLCPDVSNSGPRISSSS